MTEFRESRWRKALPWCLLAAIGFIATFYPPVVENQIASGVLWVSVSLAAVAATWKLVYPKRVFAIEENAVSITGVVPGWWKMFQRWRTVRIPISDVIDVRIGKIRKSGPIGLPVGPLGEPSRGGAVQNFIWFRYRTGETQREIYYPHFDDIQKSSQLVENLRLTFGSKVIES